NPANEKSSPKSITLIVRMFYSWALLQRVNALMMCCVKITAMGFIRCGTPDCDWGKKMPDLSEQRLELCVIRSFASIVFNCTICKSAVEDFRARRDQSITPLRTITDN